mgnify:CR=1 FL=1
MEIIGLTQEETFIICDVCEFFNSEFVEVRDFVG